MLRVSQRLSMSPRHVVNVKYANYMQAVTNLITLHSVNKQSEGEREKQKQ